MGCGDLSPRNIFNQGLTLALDPTGLTTTANAIGGALGLHSPTDYMLNPGSFNNYVNDDWRIITHGLLPDMRADRQAMVSGATTARRLAYGRSKVGCQLVYAVVSGSKNELLQIVVVFTGHAIDGFEEIWFDDLLMATSAGGWTPQGTFAGKVTFNLYDGTQSDGGLDFGGWTKADHILAGCSFGIFSLTYDETVFAAGIPTINAVLRGKKVYDPRSETTAFSNNNALCIYDYALMPEAEGGMGCASDEVNVDVVKASADICDQQVLIVSPSTYENRYSLNGSFTLDGTPASFLTPMVASMAGAAVYADGAWRFYAGAPADSVATLDESWLNGGISFKAGAAKGDKVNIVTGKFTDSTNLWSDTDFPVVPVGLTSPPNTSYWNVTATPAAYNNAIVYTTGQYVNFATKIYLAITDVSHSTPPDTAFTPPNSTYWSLVEEYSSAVDYLTGHVVQRGSVVYTANTTVAAANPYLKEDLEELKLDINLPYTITSSQAVRLANIALRRSRLGATVQYPCNLKAFALDVWDVVKVNNTLLGWSEKLFRVINWSYTPGGGVSLTLGAEDPDVWYWNETLNAPLVPPAMTNLPDPRTVAAPTSFTATEVLYAGVAVANTKSKLQLAWVSAQVSGTLYDIAFDGTIIQTIAETSFDINDLTPGTYDVSVRAKNSLGAVSSWVTVTKVVHGQNTTPTNVAAFAASFVGNLVKLSWTPNSEYDLAGYEIRTGASWTAGTVLQAALLGNGYTFRPTASGAITYWIKAFDTAGNESATAQSSSATVPTADVPTSITPISQFLEIDLDITFDTTRQDTLYVEIWAASTNDRNTASQIGVSKEKRWKHRGLNNGETRYYWTRIVTVFGETGSWYPSGATSGVQGSALNDPSQAIKLLNSEATQGDIDAMLAGQTSLIKVIDTRNMLFELGVVGTGIAATYTEALAQASSEINKNKTLLQTIDALMAGLLAPTNYNAGTSYVIGNLVLGSDLLTYQCILATTGHAPPNNTYWKSTGDIVTLLNEVQINLDAATATWTSTATSLSTRLDSLVAAVYDNTKSYVINDVVLASDHLTYKCILATTGNAPPNVTYWEETTSDAVTLLQSQIAQNANEIVLQGTAITGPLALVAGVVEDGVTVKTPEDVQGLDTAISSERIKLDSANAAILLEASRIDNLTGRTTAAEIAIDGANGAISLKASQTALDALTGTVATKAAQIDLDSANAAILLRATSTDLTGAITVLSNWVGISLSSPGATYTPGMTLTWSDASHTKSLVRFDTSSFQIGNTVSTPYSGTRAYLVDELVTYSSNTYRCILASTGNTPTNTTYWMLATGLAYRPVFSVGNINGSPAVGISGDLFIDGSVNSRTVNTDLLSAKTFIMGTASTTGVIETYNYDAASAGIRITGGATPSIVVKGGSITGTTITGSTVQTAPAGATTKRMVLNGSTNEAEFYGDRGDGTVEKIATIGLNSNGFDYVVGGFGSSSFTGVAVEAKGSIGVNAYGSQYGVICGSMGRRTQFPRKYFNGTISPCVVLPSTNSAAPTHAALMGSLWVTSAGILYICIDESNNWQKVGAQ
jgi:hypothetical protein